MNKYFLAFDYYNQDINKFYFGIVEIDLLETKLINLAGEIIKNKHLGIDVKSLTIKINAFNNVEF